MIGIVDYGMGNLESVRKALATVGFDSQWIRQPADFSACDRIVLPGVGAFGRAMDNLRQSGLIEPLRHAINEGRPFLGICLGLQLLFDTSVEHGKHRGLGLVAGRVKQLPDTVRVPHVGWNTVGQPRKSRLFTGIRDQTHFYFVQSYYVEPANPSVVAGTTDYGASFAAAIEQDNLFAVQFHPEKSQQAGLELLANFGRIPC
ncbi:imidazole glycerol phosphate synthase subunit HisH [Candidatus Bipolaricaulota bacterium]|nr:imidazole glycerol phosphate synthase subunit HisH [Candidatus Bipolaricaulota bacterium]